MDLAKETEEEYKKLDIPALKKAGIEREDIKISSHSHHIVTYPPLDSLPEINPQKIYSSKNKSPEIREIALYVHLPFCTGKCLYCAYITLPNQNEKFVDKYIDSVEKEIDLLLSKSQLNNIKINSIYIGGGTPTYLSVKQMDKLFSLLKINFRIDEDAEITVEAGPETIVGRKGELKLKKLLDHGVNRLSFGFQTFDDEILRFIRRRHDSKIAINAYKLARKIGFSNINIDLMPGLPYQSLKIWQDDLSKVAKLQPASVTCYPLSIKKTSAIWNIYKENQKIFPSRAEVIKMHIMADKFFSNIRYEQRPVWWFTKTKKFVYRQQIHKWGELGEQLALGVSGYSFINNFQYFNYRTVAQYLDAIDNAKLPIWKGIKLNKRNLMRRMILFGLKTGLNSNLFKKKFDLMPTKVFKGAWQKLEKLDLIVEENNGIISLTSKGKLFADEIAKEFYE